MNRRDSFGKRLRRGLVKLAKWGFGFIVLALAGLYGFVRYDYSSAANELPGHMERAKELGLPLSPEDMQHKPLAPADNAAPLYRELMAWNQKEERLLTGEESRTAMDSVYRESDSGLKATNAFLSRIEPMLDLAFRASERKGCDFERDWDLGPSLLFPELSHQKTAIRWLCVRGIARARSGQFDAGVSDVMAALRISVHVAEEKTLISGLVQIAGDAISMRAFNVIASFHANDNARLAKLVTALKSLPPTPELEPFLRGEVFFGYWTSLHLNRYAKEFEKSEVDAEFDGGPGFMGMGVHEWRVMPPLIPTKLVEEAYASRSLEFWNEAIAIHRAMRSDSSYLSAELDRQARRYEMSSRPSDVLGAVLFPVFAQAGTSFVKMNAVRQATLAVVEALRHRNRIGNWPKDLNAIGFEIRDPYRENPLLYRVDDKGIRIYSVYLDGMDHGGAYANERADHSSGRDLVMASHPTWASLSPPPAPANGIPQVPSPVATSNRGGTITPE